MKEINGAVSASNSDAESDSSSQLMRSSLPAFIRDVYSFIRDVYWRKSLLAPLLLALISMYDLAAGQLPSSWEMPRIGDASVPGWTWLVGVLILLLVIGNHGAYRVVAACRLHLNVRMELAVTLRELIQHRRHLMKLAESLEGLEERVLQVRDGALPDAHFTQELVTVRRQLEEAYLDLLRFAQSASSIGEQHAFEIEALLDKTHDFRIRAALVESWIDSVISELGRGTGLGDNI